MDDDLDIDGDEDTILYGDSQFFEGDIIARDDDDDTEAMTQQDRSMSPTSEDNEFPTRSLRDLVAARKMVLTLRDVDIEGEEEDERVSVASSADMDTVPPTVDLPTHNGCLDSKDAHIASLMAKIEQLVRLVYNITAVFTNTDTTGIYPTTPGSRN